jgi:iron complex outermembrane receptor protein
MEYWMDILSNPKLPVMLKLWNTGTYTKYTYEEFQQADANLSGKLIPGIPRFSQSTGLDVLLKYGISAFLTYQHGDSFYLNDANTVKNTAYNQWTARVSWKKAGVNIFTANYPHPPRKSMRAFTALATT